MKKIIIYGGSFDPFHKGHLNSAKIALWKLKADTIYFVPSYTSELKNSSSTSTWKQRYEMLKLELQKYKKFKISNWNIKNKNLYSINLVNYFLKKFPNSKLYLLIGSDQVNNLHNWKNANELCNLITIICVKRPNIKLNKFNVTKFKINIIGDSKINASSTKLRQVSNKKYLSKAIINYINNNCLYSEERIKRFLSTKRWEHCKRTALMAKQIAIKNNYKNFHEAYIAGLFHDLAKEFNKKKLMYYTNLLGIKSFTSIQTLHPYVAYYFMKYYYLFNNNRILRAVYRHTEPIQKKLSKLDKIIYVADKCESGRIKQQDKLPYNVKRIQKMAKKNINLAFNELFKILTKYFEKK